HLHDIKKQKRQTKKLGSHGLNAFYPSLAFLIFATGHSHSIVAFLDLIAFKYVCSIFFPYFG
ncbi:hypothetical protein, partial [Lacticaseibacillus paracasei]|uniref:hypothetical protein n=1 Tax=Lacticaseibacillus paracasei TaxID=1597 RepID=UPI002FFB7E9E